ncbi:MAG: peptidase M28, partial [Marinirhabdus sp.]|nr:peptidase M28 [Marinirhabdus sp.]
EDHVYVNAPLVKMITYPFSWILPLLILACVFFVGLLFYGFSKKALNGKSIGRGFAAFLLSLLSCGAVGYFGWLLIQTLYPGYAEIQHGFTYNGHWYIAFFVTLSVAIVFGIYRGFRPRKEIASYYVAPLVFWLIINTVVFIILKGAAYWIIPVFFGLVSFFLVLKQEKPSIVLLTVLAIPALIFFSPLIQFFPVGLGLKMLVISCVFVVLLFGLMVPVFARYKLKKAIVILSFFSAISLFIVAHLKSDFTDARQKPNSLVYYKNVDSGVNYWLTYDKTLDPWTQGYLGEKPISANEVVSNAAGSKYNTSYTFAAEAPEKNIAPFTVELQSDSSNSGTRQVVFTIIPQRQVNELLLYTDIDTPLEDLAFNGMEVSQDTTENMYHNRNYRRILRYVVSDRDSLEVRLSTTPSTPLQFEVLEYSYDLLNHPLFSITTRPKNTMPKPFINTDAIVVRRSFSIDDIPKKEQDTTVTNNNTNE